MKLLEEFWYGNIEPTEYDTNACKEYKEMLRLITRNKEKLLATMTDEQKELFSRYTDAVREYQTVLYGCCYIFLFLVVQQEDKTLPGFFLTLVQK